MVPMPISKYALNDCLKLLQEEKELAILAGNQLDVRKYQRHIEEIKAHIYHRDLADKEKPDAKADAW